MPELIDFTGANFALVKSELGLKRQASEPFYRNSYGNMVFFRGEHINQGQLVIPDKDNNLYGEGAYLGNSPASVTFFATVGSSLGVSVYELPEIELPHVKKRLLRIGLDRGDSALVMFPVPIVTRLAIQASYPESKLEELPLYWGLLRLKTALDKVKASRKVAWLGLSCLGKPRN